MTWKAGEVIRRIGSSTSRVTKGKRYLLCRDGGCLKIKDNKGDLYSPNPASGFWEVVEGELGNRVMTDPDCWKLKKEGVERVLWDETRNPCSEIFLEEATKPINETKKETIMSNVTNVKYLSEYVQRPTLVFGNNIAECNDGELLSLISKCKEKVEALEDLCPESTKVQNSCIEMENAIIEMVELLDGGEEDD